MEPNQINFEDLPPYLTYRVWGIIPEKLESQEPLQTVETEVNGDSKSTVQLKGVLPWLVTWACRTGTRDFCPALAALVGPVQNIFFIPYTISISLSTSPSKLGKAAVLGHLSLSMCLKNDPPPFHGWCWGGGALPVSGALLPISLCARARILSL
jgi:hypothetical protein